MVDCPCGVTADDGEAMIECERCKVRGGGTLEVQVGVLLPGRELLNACFVATGVGAPVLPAGADEPAPASLPLQVCALHV